MEALTISDGMLCIHRASNEQVREVPFGSTLELRAAGVETIASIDVVSGPPGDPAEVTDLTIAFPAGVGRYVFNVNGSLGSVLVVRVLVYSADALAKVPSAPRTGKIPTLEERKLVLRSLATHTPWFDGSAQSMAGQSLYSYGSV